MLPLLSCQASGELDSHTQERYRLSAELLMEQAARAMHDSLRGAYQSPVVALVGGGNNGGDALALARMAKFSGLDTVVALVPQRLGSLAARKLDEAREAGVRILSHEHSEVPCVLAAAGMVLDGLSGTGYRPGPERQLPLLAAVELARAAWSCRPEARRPLVVALDLPSGLAAFVPERQLPGWYKPLQADLTLTVAAAKEEMYYPGNRSFCGDIRVLDGIFPQRELQSRAGSQLLERADLRLFLPRLAVDVHKGQRGVLAVYAGNRGTSGAALLCAKAAQAAGAGMVNLITRDAVYPYLAAGAESLMVQPLSAGLTRPADATLIGPGFGADDTCRDLLRALWLGSAPLVLDADALRVCDGLPARADGLQTVLLPHPGEFASLCQAFGVQAEEAGDTRMELQAAYNTKACLQLLARKTNAVVVLKNSVSWLAHPDGRSLVYDGRVPALAAGGSGDVLAGFAGALLAAGSDAWSAAAAAVLVHGHCGRSLSQSAGFANPERLIEAAARQFYAARVTGANDESE